MRNVRDGDVGKLAVLFERHHVALFSYYFRLTRKRDLSEDLVQEVFLRILKYRRTFRGDGQFTTWMYSIARNAHIYHHRKWYREQPLQHGRDGEEDEEIADTAHADDREEKELLQQALANLPDDKRELIILSRYQDLKYSAIGELLGCTEETVKTRIHRAMKALKEEFLKLSGKEHQ
jgi:RNA polymerase sigma factor (sigma-70 family)